MKGLVTLVVCGACSGVSADLALDEPIRVPAARFVEGPLPGEAPDPDADVIDPAITLIETPNTVLRLGQAGKEVSGRASADAVAVAVAFHELGSGYWVQPLGPPDPAAGGELTWTFDAHIGWSVPTGPGALDFVAIDESGRAGRQRQAQVCVRPDLIDNFASCDPALDPPDTVIELAWDTHVDLDLVVITPEGKRVSAAAPNTVPHEPPITPAELAADGVGILDRDSNANCAIDGIERESLVFRTTPPEGTYVIYASLADACGQGSVAFTATVLRATATDDGRKVLAPTTSAAGRLRHDDADGGASSGLFLLQVAL